MTDTRSAWIRVLDGWTSLCLSMKANAREFHEREPRASTADSVRMSGKLQTLEC